MGVNVQNYRHSLGIINARFVRMSEGRSGTRRSPRPARSEVLPEFIGAPTLDRETQWLKAAMKATGDVAYH
jgi:hypothetical protein